MALMNSQRTYGAVAVTLHWLIAIAIIYMVFLGKTMEDDFAAIQLHKSLGITILALSVLRLGWRLINPQPALPEGMSGLERFGARATHWLFYFLMIAIPLSGWAYVSASPFSDMIKTRIWGVIELPNLPFFAGMENREEIAERIEGVHGALGYLPLLALLALHVLAALKHHFWNRDTVLTRMLPFIPAPRSRS